MPSTPRHFPIGWWCPIRARLFVFLAIHLHGMRSFGIFSCLRNIAKFSGYVHRIIIIIMIIIIDCVGSWTTEMAMLPMAGITCPSLRLSQAQCGNTTFPYPGNVRHSAKYSAAFLASCNAFSSYSRPSARILLRFTSSMACARGEKTEIELAPAQTGWLRACCRPPHYYYLIENKFGRLFAVRQSCLAVNWIQPPSHAQACARCRTIVLYI